MIGETIRLRRMHFKIIEKLGEPACSPRLRPVEAGRIGMGGLVRRSLHIKLEISNDR